MPTTLSPRSSRRFETWNPMKPAAPVTRIKSRTMLSCEAKEKMKNRWSEKPASPIEQLVYQSRLVGAEESLVLWGGGNNSVKSTATDLLGRSIDGMLIKSSGSAMKTIAPRQVSAVRPHFNALLPECAGISGE